MQLLSLLELRTWNLGIVCDLDFGIYNQSFKECTCYRYHGGV